MEKNPISRRKLLAAAAGGIALSFIVVYGKDKILLDTEELRATINKLNIPAPQILSAGVTILPGVSNIEDHVTEFFHALSDQGLSNHTTVEQLKTLIARDFSVGRVFYADGWSMSHTELALCFLREGR